MKHTDPFVSWTQEKKAQPMAQYKPSRLHERLVARPPTHLFLKGDVAIVIEYKGDCLWLVTVHQQPITVHELDCTIISRDWELYPT